MAIKHKCVACGKPFNEALATDDERRDRHILQGNFCLPCCARAIKVVARSMTKKRSDIMLRQRRLRFKRHA